MGVHPTVTASTMITHVCGAAQGQMSHTGCGNLWEIATFCAGIVPGDRNGKLN
jgi:hypothetical protein